LDLSSIWIGYPILSEAVRYRISQIKFGALVHLEKREDENRVFIRDSDDQKIGALSRAASDEWTENLDKIKEARVHSVINWRKEFLNQDPADNCPDEWEVPLLEIVTVGEAENE
jgi:hypothetical protein